MTSNASIRDRVRVSLEARSTAASVLRNRDGIEVSIPNIIVAIVVSLVVIASVVAGVVFLIPFAQNSSAQSNLQTVQAAQQVYFAQAAPPVYGTGAELVAKKALLSSDKKVAIGLSPTKEQYCAGALSDTGNVYYLTSESTTVVTAIPAAFCPSIAAITASELN